MTAKPFEPGTTATGPRGAVAHPLAIDHVKRLELKLFEVGDSAWCVVGNGLSNQSFVEGPEGLIVIDTGESIEEMNAALKLVREKTSAPVVACIYTHFHYVNGTAALLPETTEGELLIVGHRGIEDNRRRMGGEINPRIGRGVAHQFGTALPPEGADALLSCGLGLFLRNPGHAPYTNGYMPAKYTFDQQTRMTIAGLDVELTPAPSDATDSITIWFPELRLCVNNLVWPALFNVFAIRGEEYRDPRILLTGIDHIVSLSPSWLMCTHGPPMEGEALIRREATRYRDAIQFLWDQTVRGANKGLTMGELIEFVQLPDIYSESHTTQQLYGVAEHHVRQIYTGLFGWFDEDDANLFPLPARERAERMIVGFGGKDEVRRQARAALDAADYRWAIELANWLVRSTDSTAEDRALLARCLRGVAQSSTSANIRNWCLTRALELEGTIELSRLRAHRLLATLPLQQAVGALRVLLDPLKVDGVNRRIAFSIADEGEAGLHIRGGVAVPTDDADADVRLTTSRESWASLLGNKVSLTELMADGRLAIEGDETLARQLLGAFDLPAFSR